MALSKPALLKALIAHSHGLPNRFRPAPSIRFFSFSSPEEAAAERRRRKRRLRMEPPLGSLQRSHQTSSPPPNPENPNAPKLPEPVSALSGKRLDLHKKILNLIRENDLEEAALFTKHSVYSNCRPTIYTVNAVLTAQLRQSKYGDLLTLHRFSNSAGIVPTVGTYNLLFQTYLDCGKPDMALDYYKQMVNEAPFSPSPATYRVLIKGLVDNGLVDRAVELKDEMVELKGFSPDPIVYHYLMTGFAREKDADRVFKVYEEFKERSGVDGDGVVEDGTVYGGLMKGYFLRGMEKEAMECYEFAVGENSKVRMNDVAYNSVLDALAKYHESDKVLKLFDRMLSEHNPPLKLSVNLGSFNVMVDWYCARGRFKDAIEVFKRMEAYGCVPDVLSYNNLIDQLCANGSLVEAEEVYGKMDKKGVRPDEYTFGVLMDTCFKEGRIDDGAAYFNKMVDLELRPNLAVYDRMVDHLMKAGKLDQAKSCYDLMVKKLKMDNASYKFMMGALSDAGRLDDMLKMVGEMLDDETIGLDEELREFVKGELRKEGREDDLGKLIEDKERQKAEAKAREVEEAEATKRNARAAIASLFPPKSANKEGETGTEETNQDSAATAPTSEESPQTGNAGDVEELSSSADLNSTDDAMKA